MTTHDNERPQSLICCGGIVEGCDVNLRYYSYLSAYLTKNGDEKISKMLRITSVDPTELKLLLNNF